MYKVLQSTKYSKNCKEWIKYFLWKLNLQKIALLVKSFFSLKLDIF